MINTFDRMNLLYIVLAVLLAVSIFFSASETGMMSLNRYRLRHLVRKGKSSAKRTAKLLERPDRLLGVILIGNTFANIMASAVATMIAVHFFGDLGVFLSMLLLSFFLFIFGETAPKTYAALYPERVAFPVSFILMILLKILYPLVWIVNAVSNGVLRLFRVDIRGRHGAEPLSPEELRTLVHEATGKISSSYQQMLLRILELERVTVEDVMVPRNEIIGIDLDQDWQTIEKCITESSHGYLPLYRENIQEVLGILNLRKVLSAQQKGSLNKNRLIELADKVYFVPGYALLNHQLVNFQNLQKDLGLVVDEYGEIEGLITLQDIVEEVIGEFENRDDLGFQNVKKQKDGSFLVDGMMHIRDLNRIMHWHLPTDGPRTLSGLVIEYLEIIPQSDVGARIAGYPMEVREVKGNIIKLVQIWPEQYRARI